MRSTRESGPEKELVQQPNDPTRDKTDKNVGDVIGSPQVYECESTPRRSSMNEVPLRIRRFVDRFARGYHCARLSSPCTHTREQSLVG